MTEELIQTLQIIKSRYGSRTSGSVFIPLKDFPWYFERNNQLTKLYEKGMIAKPRFFDNGAEIILTKAGHTYFEGILFPSSGEPLTCPVCGFRATVLNTDASRSWAEIHCENCSTYSIKKDALINLSSSDFHILSGYYRHVWHEPMTMQCDSQETVKNHVDETRKMVNRDFQMKSMLSHYYQKMTSFEDAISVDNLPAIAYAKDNDDLQALTAETIQKGFVIVRNETITVTEKGKEWMDTETLSSAIMSKRKEIFISHRTTDGNVADLIKDFLVNTGIPNEQIFCSSLPGNDVGEQIGTEVKAHLKSADIIILILSEEYYESAYCLNEAGVAWFLDDVLAIPFGLPEIDHTKMVGFFGSDYKLRRLNNADDVSYLYDRVQERLATKNVTHSIITREMSKLEERYERLISDKKTTSLSGESRKTTGKIGTSSSTQPIDTSVSLSETYGGDVPVEAAYLLVFAADGDGQILRIQTLSSPVQIIVNGKQIILDETPRESARWLEALDRLVSLGWVKQIDKKGEIYKLTGIGYKNADSFKESMKINTDEGLPESVNDSIE